MARRGCTTIGRETTTQRIGRFIAEDPIDLDGGVNQYSYVSNDPANSTDPSGLCTRFKFVKDAHGDFVLICRDGSGSAIDGIRVTAKVNGEHNTAGNFGNPNARGGTNATWSSGGIALPSAGRGGVGRPRASSERGLSMACGAASALFAGNLAMDYLGVRATIGALKMSFGGMIQLARAESWAIEGQFGRTFGAIQRASLRSAGGAPVILSNDELFGATGHFTNGVCSQRRRATPTFLNSFPVSGATTPP